MGGNGKLQQNGVEKVNKVAETAIVPITGKNVGDNFSQGLEELQ